MPTPKDDVADRALDIFNRISNGGKKGAAIALRKLNKSELQEKMRRAAKARWKNSAGKKRYPAKKGKAPS